MENNVCTGVANCFCANERVIWCLFPELRKDEGNEHQNNTRVGAEQFVTRVYTLLYFLRDIRIHKWRRKRRSSHIDTIKQVMLGLLRCFDTSTQFLACPDYILQMTSQSIADDVTITRQLWRQHMKISISNSLDIYFTHGDFHNWSCKKKIYPPMPKLLMQHAVLQFDMLSLGGFFRCCIQQFSLL